MRRYAMRLLIALIVSTACSGVTFYLFPWTDSSSASISNKDPIAVLSGHHNDVQRKPLARVIWETISKDTPLYPGEAIRTSNVSEASIKFLKTGAIIELEPDSLVVLEENENGIALDFLAGNLFVKGGGKGDRGTAGLQLKSGNKKIDLSNANLSLSKSDKGGLDMEVFEGKVQGGEGLNIVKNQIKVTYPEPGEPVYLDLKKNPEVTFQWEKLPKGYKVYLERGDRRGRLARLEAFEADGEAGKLKVSSKVGKFYWRLVAVPVIDGNKERHSGIVRTQVIAKAPPVLLAPEKDALVVINKENSKLKIKWAMKTKLSNLVVEVARDKFLKQKVTQKYLDENVTFDDVEIKKGGQYFWRITGFMKIKGKLEPVSSEIRGFKLKVGVELIPPKLLSPVAKQTISFNQVVANGLFMTWDAVPGIKNYEIVIQPLKKRKKAQAKAEVDAAKVITKTTSQSPLRLQTLAPGSYTWFAYSIDDKGKKSSPSKKRTFTIDEMPKVKWVKGPDPEVYEYFTAKPTARVEWLAGNKTIKSWRVRYALTGFLEESTKWIPRKKPELKLNLKKDGDYDFEVEGLNAKGAAVARSTVKAVTVRPKPLLPPPRFASSLPETLKSTRSGTLSLKWEPVTGAKAYKIEVRNLKGKVTRKKTVDRTTASISRMKPGEYKVFVKAIDKYERDGSDGDPKAAKVPSVSNIKAPKIKAIKVK